MRIEIRSSDIELLLSGLSHCLNAYGRVIRSIALGCEIPIELTEYINKLDISDYDELVEHFRKRFNVVKNLYEKIEQEETNVSSSNAL